MGCKKKKDKVQEAIAVIFLFLLMLQHLETTILFGTHGLLYISLER